MLFTYLCGTVTVSSAFAHHRTWSSFDVRSLWFTTNLTLIRTSKKPRTGETGKFQLLAFTCLHWLSMIDVWSKSDISVNDHHLPCRFCLWSREIGLQRSVNLLSYIMPGRDNFFPKWREDWTSSGIYLGLWFNDSSTNFCRMFTLVFASPQPTI